MVLSDVGDAVVEERVSKAVKRHRHIGPCLLVHAAGSETGHHLALTERIEPGAHLRIGEDGPHRLACRPPLPHPSLGEHGVAKIEDVQLEPLEGLEIVGDRHRGMDEGRFEARLALDRPQGVGLGDRTDRLDRFGDDTVNQRVGEDDAFFDPRVEGDGSPACRGEPRAPRQPAPRHCG